MAIIDRPFALIGRSPGADLPVPTRDASLRHVYLHLGPRGVFAVDLASRTGTRFDGVPADTRSCWLAPGRGLELAGHRVELLEASPPPSTTPAEGDDPLGEVPGLCGLELLPEGRPDHPVALLSELSFLGRSRSCAVQAEGDDVARVHAVVVRTALGAHVVNLACRSLTIGGEPVAPVLAIRDGDLLQLGRSRFAARLGPSPSGRPPSRSAVGLSSPVTLPVPDEPGDRLMARALQAVRQGHDELLQSNDQFQRALLAVVRQLYEDQAALFDRHMERLDRLQREIAELRMELRERPGPEGSPPSPSQPKGLDAPPLEAPRGGPSGKSGRATSWLLDRIGELEEQVDQESRSGWRDFLSRLGPPLRAREDA
ncbi:FHA domain protein (plasmid) [Tautonia plasticadhaerens]|uniref:FHA domain protein n=1 Tax=Tautonia plasticadhaerens TaxID=2527974 RepID=A0A518HFM5_9BACT|nr:FHA domain protein [Tautonia plasticadhaerens]